MIPAAVLPLLRQVLDQIAEGTSVAVLDDDAELSTQQAADYLGISRPFFIGLLDRGVLPFRKVGAHRRIQARDVIDHKRRDQADRLKALEELAARPRSWGWATDMERSSPSTMPASSTPPRSATSCSTWPASAWSAPDGPTRSTRNGPVTSWSIAPTWPAPNSSGPGHSWNVRS